MKTVSEPKLYVYKLNGQPSVRKEWYVYVRFKHPGTGEWVTKKDRSGINYFNTVKGRMKEGKLLLKFWKEAVSQGYTPFNIVEKEVVEAKEKLLIDLIREMLEIKRASIKKRSYQAYKFSVDLFEAYLKDSDKLKIKPFQFRHGNDFGDWLGSVRGYKGKTFNDTVGFLRIMFNMAVDREIIDKNPLKQIKKQREKTGTHLAFNDTQKAALKEYLQEHDKNLWVFVQFIYYCFIRPIELLRLKVSDVKLESSQVFVYSGDSKNADQKAVEIPDVFIKEVKKLNLEQYPQDYFLFSKNLSPGKKGIWRGRISDRHTAVLRALDFPKGFTLYSWKHTGNCDCARAGVGLYWLMRQNRHSSPDMTLKYLRCLGMERNIEFRTKAPKL